MTIYINDLPYIIQHFTNREVDWVYAQFVWEGYTYLENTEQKRDRLEEYMHRSKETHDQVRQLQLQSNSFLLTDDELEWVESTDRKFLFWLKIKLPTYQTGNSPLTPFNGSNFPDRGLHNAFIFQLDIWPTTLHSKRNFLDLLRSDWSKQQQLDKKQAWLDIENIDQTAWAWEYLQENIPRLPDTLLPSNTIQQLASFELKLNPTTPEETYYCIFASFYGWKRDSAALREIQGKMKQAWAQQKYRSNLKNEDKKQSTYVLSTEAKVQLKKMAKINNVNLNQMLEYIINQAFKSHKKVRPDD